MISFVASVGDNCTFVPLFGESDPKTTQETIQKKATHEHVYVDTYISRHAKH